MIPLLPLMFLPPAAGAATDPPVAAEPPGPTAELPATVAGWSELYIALRTLHERLGRPVALGAVGPEARAVGRKATSLFSAGEVQLRPIPTVGDPAAELALAQRSTGARCVVWMTPAADGWALDPRGDCTTPDTSVPPRDLPPLLQVVPRRGDPSWRVQEVGDGPIDAWRYATLTRDPELRDRLVTERRRHRSAARLLEIAGVVVAGAAAIPILDSFQLDDPQLVEDRWMTAAFMVTTGGTLVVGGILDRRGLDARQAEVAGYVHRADAEAAIEDWNQEALRRRARLQAPPAVDPLPGDPAPPGPAEPNAADAHPTVDGASPADPVSGSAPPPPPPASPPGESEASP